jgi:hypothetical protein
MAMTATATVTAGMTKTKVPTAAAVAAASTMVATVTAGGHRETITRLNPFQNLVVASSAKQRQQQQHHQRTHGGLQVQSTWTYFNLSSTVFFLLKLVEAHKNSFPMKTERVFGCFCTICTAFNIGSCGKRNNIPANSPNLKSPFPEFLGNSLGMHNLGVRVAYVNLYDMWVLRQG